MYPNLYYVFKDFFGIEIDLLRFINSFGFFVAIAFLAAAALLGRELKRKGKLGLFQPTETKMVVGKPATGLEIATNAFLGFLLGYKLLALFFLGKEVTQDPQAYIFSARGSWPAGLLVAALFGWLRWRDGKKAALAKPEERSIRIWPHDRVGEFTIIALILGLVGAKLFDIFENWSAFLQTPAEYIFSGGGLTFYGGLICAALGIAFYCRKNKISVRHFADSIAPALMAAYAIGRIGCQVAGDGDWGIYNSAYKVNGDNSVSLAAPAAFTDSVMSNQAFFSRHYSSPEEVHQAAFPKPAALSFLPNWLFAYAYPHNVNETGVKIPGCEGRYCNRLPVPVFPTPLYETITCGLLFLLLWGVRKRMRPAGGLFCLYLIVNGIERFLIEKIRVNNKMDFLGFHPTQAEVISGSLVLVGILLWVLLYTKYRTSPEKL